MPLPLGLGLRRWLNPLALTCQGVLLPLLCMAGCSDYGPGGLDSEGSRAFPDLGSQPPAAPLQQLQVARVSGTLSLGLRGMAGRGSSKYCLGCLGQACSPENARWRGLTH